MSSAALEADRADASKVSILVIDDHPPSLVDFQAASRCYDIISVSSVAEALRAVASNDVAVILVSAEMSVVGDETAAQFKALARVPILVFTAVAPDAERLTKAGAWGAVDVVHRSFVTAKVAVFVELHTARKRVAHLTASLAHADQLQQQFLATLGEELRAPLTTILGWIRMLRDGTIRESLRARALETVEHSASAQLELIQEMIDISRMTSGTLTLELGPLDLKQLVEDAIAAARPAALEKQVTLHAALDDDIAPMSGDRERLRQVVERLVTDAVENTPTEGLVTVSLSNIGSQVELAITDTGIGIDPQVLPRLFDRFVGETLDARAGGGLGLAIVRHLVELHDGTISAESAGVGLGCRFVVNLPAEGRKPRTDDEVR